MNSLRIQLSGVALLAAAAIALLIAPIHARADTGLSDRHEIPVFVLERIEIALDAHGREA
jgi:hypothetical protein